MACKTIMQSSKQKMAGAANMSVYVHEVQGRERIWISRYHSTFHGNKCLHGVLTGCRPFERFHVGVNTTPRGGWTHVIDEMHFLLSQQSFPL